MNAKYILIGNAMIAAMFASAPAVATGPDTIQPVPAQIQAGDSTTSAPDPSNMSMREYEIYRAALQRQIEDRNSSAAKDKPEAETKDTDRDQAIPAGTGYGQGYRARHRHGLDGNGTNFSGGRWMAPGAGRNH